MLKDATVRNVVISYDVACKWSIHHLERFSKNHPDLNVNRFQFSYLVPKFHLPGHGTPCQTEYSFNLLKGVGRTYSETIEQEWAHINLAALLTREMGPGACHLTLDDGWNWWNWKKILGMGMTNPTLPLPTNAKTQGDLFLRNLIKALAMKDKHSAVIAKFNAVFSEDLHQEWAEMISQWEQDRTKPNPYTHTEKGTICHFTIPLHCTNSHLASNTAEVRRRLAEADQQDTRQGSTPHQVPASVFVCNGLEIEDQQ